jgi:hypothetical protein
MYRSGFLQVQLANFAVVLSTRAQILATSSCWLCPRSECKAQITTLLEHWRSISTHRIIGGAVSQESWAKLQSALFNGEDRNRSAFAAETDARPQGPTQKKQRRP